MTWACIAIMKPSQETIHPLATTCLMLACQYGTDSAHGDVVHVVLFLLEIQWFISVARDKGVNFLSIEVTTMCKLELFGLSRKNAVRFIVWLVWKFTMSVMPGPPSFRGRVVLNTDDLVWWPRCFVSIALVCLWMSPDLSWFTWYPWLLDMMALIRFPAFNSDFIAVISLLEYSSRIFAVDCFCFKHLACWYPEYSYVYHPVLLELCFNIAGSFHHYYYYYN